MEVTESRGDPSKHTLGTLAKVRNLRKGGACSQILRHKSWVTSDSRPIMAAIVLSFVVLATVYSVATPAWETPDEFWHVAYAAHMRETGALPVIGVTPIASSQHPPLYYLLVAGLTLPVDISRLHTDFEVNPRFVHHGGMEVNYARHGSSETFPYENFWALALHSGATGHRWQWARQPCRSVC